MTREKKTPSNIHKFEQEVTDSNIPDGETLLVVDIPIKETSATGV